MAEKEGFELEKADYIGKNAVQLSYVLPEYRAPIVNPIQCNTTL